MRARCGTRGHIWLDATTLRRNSYSLVRATVRRCGNKLQPSPAKVRRPWHRRGSRYCVHIGPDGTAHRFDGSRLNNVADHSWPASRRETRRMEWRGRPSADRLFGQLYSPPSELVRRGLRLCLCGRDIPHNSDCGARCTFSRCCR